MLFSTLLLEILLEIQAISHPDLLNQNLPFNKIPRIFEYTLKYAKHWGCHNSFSWEGNSLFLFPQVGVIGSGWVERQWVSQRRLVSFHCPECRGKVLHEHVSEAYWPQIIQLSEIAVSSTQCYFITHDP